jgi:hypothetical protein
MAAEQDLTIRPLTVGEVLDRTLALYLRHFRALFATMLVFQVPVHAMGRAYMTQICGLIDGHLSTGSPAALNAAMTRFALVMMGMIALLYLLQLLGGAAVAALVAPSLMGTQSQGGLRGLPRRAGPVLAMAAVLMMALGTALAVGSGPGVLLAIHGGSAPAKVGGFLLAFLGAMFAFMLVLIRFVLAPAASAVEGLGGWAALRRSARLMRAPPGARFLDRPGVRASVLLFAVFVLPLAVNSMVGLPRAAAYAFSGHSTLRLCEAPLPIALEIALTLFEGCAAAALQPFSLAAMAVFYFDRRARREGYDLEMWADGLAAAGGARR